jgi:hypothetical protein
MVMPRRETLVQLTDELVEELDKAAARQGVKRSQLIRSVLESFVLGEDIKAKDRRLIEGYTRIPPGGTDAWGDTDAWGEALVRLAGDDQEPWE